MMPCYLALVKLNLTQDSTMSKRMNLSVDEATADKVRRLAERESRTEAGMALKLIKEGIEAREVAVK